MTKKKISLIFGTEIALLVMVFLYIGFIARCIPCGLEYDFFHPFGYLPKEPMICPMVVCYNTLGLPLFILSVDLVILTTISFAGYWMIKKMKLISSK
jgi:hypothetical protein